MKDVFDLNEYRYKKEREKVKEEIKKDRSENARLLEEITTKPMHELDPSQMAAYSEIKVVFTFLFRNIHQVFVVEFRNDIYLMNLLTGGVFEFLGSIEDILESFV